MTIPVFDTTALAVIQIKAPHSTINGWVPSIFIVGASDHSLPLWSLPVRIEVKRKTTYKSRLSQLVIIGKTLMFVRKKGTKKSFYGTLASCVQVPLVHLVRHFPSSMEQRLAVRWLVLWLAGWGGERERVNQPDGLPLHSQPGGEGPGQVAGRSLVFLCLQRRA